MLCAIDSISSRIVVCRQLSQLIHISHRLAESDKTVYKTLKGIELKLHLI